MTAGKKEEMRKLVMERRICIWMSPFSSSISPPHLPAAGAPPLPICSWRRATCGCARVCRILRDGEPPWQRLPVEPPLSHCPPDHGQGPPHADKQGTREAPLTQPPPRLPACPTPACSVSSEISGTIVGNSNSELPLPCLMQQHQRAASVSVEGSEQIPEHHLVQVIPPSRDAYSCLGHVNYPAEIIWRAK